MSAATLRRALSKQTTGAAPARQRVVMQRERGAQRTTGTVLTETGHAAH